MIRTLPAVLVCAIAVASCGGDSEPDAGADETVDDSVADGEGQSDEDGDVIQLGPFDIEGETAVMVDEIDSETPDAVRTLIADHPDVSTIELVNVPGSADDEANLEASRLVREAGLATHVPADGEIASGGVDFFLSGATRSYDDGARFGVHSWSGDGIEGADLPADDPEHDLFLDFYGEMGVDEDFYWFTLEAAPSDDIHWMTPDELDTYEFASGS